MNLFRFYHSDNAPSSCLQAMIALTANNNGADGINTTAGRRSRIMVPLLFILLGSVPLTLLSGGCGVRQTILTDVAADDSGSFTLARRTEGMEMLDDIVRQAYPVSGSMTRIWLFSQKAGADPKFEGRVRNAADLRKFAAWYRSGAGTTTQDHGTFGAPLLQSFLEEARRANARGRGERLVFLLITDGGFNDLEAISRVVLELARCPTVAAVWIGPVALDKNVQAGVDKAFAPLRADGRLIISNRLDARWGPARLREAIRRG